MYKTSVENEQSDKITKNSGMVSGKNGSKVYVSRGTIRFWRCVSCETKAPQKCLKMQKNSRFSMIFRRKLVVWNNFSFFLHLNFPIEKLRLSPLKFCLVLFRKKYKKIHSFHTIFIKIFICCVYFIEFYPKYCVF